MGEAKRKRARAKAAGDLGHLPPPPISPEVDLRDVPIPVDAFIDLAVQQWGIDREEAAKFVLEQVARMNDAKGNA